jgi:hypothetical protein
MYTCESCQSRLLHHLYGLLDETERAGLLAHLNSCPACQAALDRARTQQQILAAAAKGGDFPDVRFTPVSTQRPTITLQITPPATQVRRRAWARWAVAACILLLLGSAASFAGIAWYGHHRDVEQARLDLEKVRKQEQELRDKQAKDDQATQNDISRIEEQIRQVENQFREDLQKVQKSYENNQVQVNIQTPRALQAGAPNAIRIEAKPRDQKAAASMKLMAQVVDTKSKDPLMNVALKEGVNDITLPPSLPIQPGHQISLRVVGDANETLVDESLPLVTSVYVTHLMTDRPLYRPGEVVYFRSLTLERFSLKPADQDFELAFRLVKMLGKQEQVVEVHDPENGGPAKLTGLSRVLDKDGKAILGPDGKELRGIGAGAFRLPEELGGGEYTLIVSETHDRFPAERRRIIVNRYQAPRLYKDVDFTRKSYGPGDVVTASCKVSPVEGGRILAGLPVEAFAEVDGVKCELITKGELKTNDRGECAVQFKLPSKIERGEGVLTVTFTDGGNVESTVEPIPIILKKLKVEFFPEGGELVAGLKNRVYFQVRTPTNRPAELTGRIVDSRGQDVVGVHTFHDSREIGVNQGMGYFEFVPEAGQKYELKIDSPEGVEGEGKFAIDHPVQEAGVLLHVPAGVVTEKINLVVTSAKKDRKLLVGAYCRGQLLDHQTVKAGAGKALPVTLTPANGVGGVYRVTVFEVAESGDLLPQAERLLYRRSPEKLNLKIFTDKKTYIPGDKVMLSLSATTEQNRPAPAIVVVSVVDRSILKLRNDRTARSMPAHFLLTSEVRGPEDLEYADFLLREVPQDAFGLDVAKAEMALDLLLGTQGWRRFIEQNQPQQRKELVKAYKEDVPRFLQVTGQDKVKEVKNPTAAAKADKAVNKYLEKERGLQKELAAKEAVQDQQRAAVGAEAGRLDNNVAAKAEAVSRAEAEQKEFNKRAVDFGWVALALLLCIGAFALLFAGVDALSKGRPQAKPILALGLLCVVALPCLGVTWLVWSGAILPGKALHSFGVEDEAAPQRMAEGRAGGGRGAAMDQARAAQGLPAPGKDVAIGKAPPPNDIKGGGQANVPLLKGPVQVGAKGPMRPGNEGKLFAMEQPPVGLKQPAVLEFVPGQARLANAAPGIQVWKVDPERVLRKGGKSGEVAVDRLSKEEAKFLGGEVRVKHLPAAEAMIIRQYAHRHQTSEDGVRRDFTETIFWHPVLVLPGDKALDVSFDLSDAVTRFEVQAWAHSLDGRLGALTQDITSVLPFSVDAKLPTEISSTDKLKIPVTIANDTDKNRLVKLTYEAEKLKLQTAAEQDITINANQRRREILQLVPIFSQGEAKLRLTGKSTPFAADAVERSFKIVPEGFPIEGKSSDLLEKTVTHTVKLPARRDDWVPGTLKMQAQVFPSTLADLQKGLEAMLREPHGCFEQTSSSNYPNIMILDYLKESDQLQPQTEKKARELVDRGYGRLVTFECVDPATRTKKQGYEWFGQTAPPHEALTAYGLLEFLDMSRYYPVDKEMVERTKQYLLGQRDKKGGFLKNARALDGFGGAPAEVANAYIVWALCEADVKEDIKLELDTAAALAEKTQDSYLVALAGLSLLKRGESDRALTLLKGLRGKQQADGSVAGAKTSITRSGGSQLAIETTSLAVLAWLRANQPADFDQNVRKSVDWIGKQRGSIGGYGSTQSTILALKALIAHTRANKKTAEAGEIRLYIGDRAEPVAVTKFAAGAQDALTVEVPDEKLLQPGENKIRVEITGKNVFPHTLSWSYMALTPANKDVCPVRLETSLATATAKEGETVRLSAKLSNASGEGQGMAVAILGMPAGCALPTDLQELRNMVKEGTIDAFEVQGRELVLYWRQLAKDAKLEVNVHLICQIPGEYRGPASRAYLYYNADERWWTPPVGIGITPK